MSEAERTPDSRSPLDQDGELSHPHDIDLEGAESSEDLTTQKLADMPRAEFADYAHSVEAKFNKDELALIEGQDIETIAAVRDRTQQEVGEMRSKLVADFETEGRTLSDRAAQLYSDFALTERVEANVNTLFGGIIDETEQARLRANVEALITMPDESYGELTAKWRQLREVQEAEVMRAEEERENPVFVEIREEMAERRRQEAAEQARIEQEAQAEKHRIMRGIESLGGTNHDNTNTKPNQAPAPKLIDGRFEVPDTNERITVTVLMPDGRRVSQEVIGMDMNKATILVNESTTQKGQKPAEPVPHEVGASSDEAVVLHDQLLRHRKDGVHRVELSLSQYEQLYGPWDLQTGDRFQVFGSENGEYYEGVLQPIRPGQDPPRTVKFTRYSADGHALDHEVHGSMDWFAEFMDEYQRHNDGRPAAEPIPYDKWQEIHQARAQKREAAEGQELINALNRSDVIDDNHFVRKLTGNRIVIVNNKGNEETLSPAEAARFARHVEHRRRVFGPVYPGREYIDSYWDSVAGEYRRQNVRVISADRNHGVVTVEIIDDKGVTRKEELSGAAVRRLSQELLDWYGF